MCSISWNVLKPPVGLVEQGAAACWLTAVSCTHTPALASTDTVCVQWFLGYAEQLAAGGADCLYSVKLPSSARGGTHSEAQQLPCTCHFGLRGPDRQVSSYVLQVKRLPVQCEASHPEGGGGKRGGASHSEAQQLPCICHFGLRGPDR